MHQLRLSDGRGQTIEFEATGSRLSSQVNDAYLSYCQSYQNSAVILEIFHRTHGWQPVYDHDGYCRMIQNPLRVDYRELKKDICHTMTIVNTWPTNKQKKILEARRIELERQRSALKRRDGFTLIQGGGM